MKPDRTELEHWKRNPVTVYVMDLIKGQFRASKSHERAKSWDDHNMMVGQQQVIHAIEKLCGD